MIEEGNVKINLKEGVFYNPHMEFSRDISSLLISALPEINLLCDGMCATGIRGIRYAIENKNVKKVIFVDIDKNACNAVKENLMLNNLNLDDFEVLEEDFNHFMYLGKKKFKFIELDPFGSPVPFLRSALFNLREKGGILSVTATDTAVLCGAQPKACQIKYGAKPLDNYFCHETGVRIIIGHIARVASPLNLGIEPLVSLSKRHYFKIILKVKKGAIEAFESIKQLGFVSWCPACFDTKIYYEPTIEEKCECGSLVEWAGPLWLGKIFDTNTLEKMKDENQKRNYKNKREISTILYLMSQEADIPPFYFDLHSIFDKIGISPKKFDIIVNHLQRKGFKVSRTHFNNHAIKTNASAKDIFDILKS